MAGQSAPVRLGGEPGVDVVVPVYGERSEALAQTLRACLQQSHPISNIFVVDDGSPKPVRLPDLGQPSAVVTLIRIPQNGGIAAARNAGIARSDAPFLACVNCEVLPNADWLSACLAYLSEHPDVGACFTRTSPHKPRRLLTRWRVRFLEQRYPDVSGPALWAPGHAVLLRRDAVDAIGGYDVRYRLYNEDFDICQRMRKAGWETHYLCQSGCTSIQEDSLHTLALKLVQLAYWSPAEESPLLGVYGSLTKWTFIRAGRNVVKGRFYFLPVDVALWANGLAIATSRILKNRLKSSA